MIKFKDLFSFSRKEVKHTFACGKPVFRHRFLKIIEAPCEPRKESDLDLVLEVGQTHGKLLIVTSRKIGKAHDRNLLRRRVKEIFHTHQLYLSKNALFVLFTYPGAVKLSYEELKDFLVSNFSKAKHEAQ